MAILTNSDRHILKATHVPIDVDGADFRPSRASDKAAFVNRLRLEPGEVEHIRRSTGDRSAERISDEVWSVAQQYEPALIPTLAPRPSLVANIGAEELASLGEAVVAYRATRLAAMTESPDWGDAPADKALMAPATRVDVARQQTRVAFAQSALQAFTSAMQISPIGMLHLERIEMAPAGVERGELLATIPLAPEETTSVVQKEWTVTSQELSTIVTDFLEDYSEKGVTEKAELADATESQTKRSQQLGFDASVSGTYGFVTFATSAKFASTVDTEQSSKASRKHASEVTGKASARVRKERKVTIQSSSTTGREDSSTRTLTNPSATDTMRIDYYSMMRKWRVRLFQYGLRLTYDIAIPEPGATLRKLHAQVATIDSALSVPFIFPLKQSDITRSTYLTHAATYAATVPEPPLEGRDERIGGPVPGLDKNDGWHFNELALNVPDGYEIAGVFLDAFLGNVNNDQPGGRAFVVIGAGAPKDLNVNGKASFVEDWSGLNGFLIHRTGPQKIVYFIQNIDSGAVTFALHYAPLASTMDQWQAAVWQTIFNTARDNYYAGLQALADRRAALMAKILNVDTLTLRREERDEITKGVLRWLLGPSFDFMPPEVTALFTGNATEIALGESFTGNQLGLDPQGWATMFIYQEMVKFIQEAIEWENMLYFPYAYFWDVPVAWDFIRTLEHPDSTRQQFLRSGSARVVLTIRPGYEESFAAFVDQGSLGTVLPPNHPYLTIGQEIRAYDQTNYPGIPPANPEANYRPLLTPGQRKAWSEMQAIISLLDAHRQLHGSYPTTAQGLAALAPLGTVPAADPWGNAYVYTSPGAFNDFDLVSLGADGKSGGVDENTDVTSGSTASLISEWFEYTPTHGTDIEINTAPAKMA